MKKLLLLMLTLSLAFCLFSCGGGTCTHADGNGDGICDKCEKTMGTPPPEEYEDLVLIENGKANFQFVITGDSVSADVIKSVTSMISELRKLKVTVTRVTAGATSGTTADKPQEIEVLIGNVTQRGEEYDYNAYDLGKKGYVVELVGKKVIIDAVDEKYLLKAIEEFRTKILGLPATSLPDTVKMSSTQNIKEVQTGYPVTALKVNGADMKGYTIATDLLNSTYYDVAKWAQDKIYDATGYYFPIVDIAYATERSFVIQPISKESSSNLKIYTKQNGQLVIESPYINKITSAVENFVNDSILARTGEVNFSGTMKDVDVSFITYEEYGAKGDGITDDFAAIYKAHVDANEGGQRVIATPGKTYLLRSNKVDGNYVTIPIQTNVTWTGANFIIDDSNLNPWTDSQTYEKYVFTVTSDKAMYTITDTTTINSILASGLNRGTTKVTISGIDYPVMIMPYNTSHKIFRRTTNYEGQDMHEVIVLDKNGNVSPDTPIIYDYKSINRIDVYPLNIEPITIEGGHFTTLAGRISTWDEAANDFKGTYFNRGINICRSFTTMRGVQHVVEGEFNLKEQAEGNIGSPYHGFYSAHNATDILYEDCTFVARRCYREQISRWAHTGVWDSGGATGTYAHNAWNVNNLTYKNFQQTNFWITIDADGNIHAADKDDPGAQSTMFFAPIMSYGDNYNPNNANHIKRYQMFWGSGGTNFCKNVVMDNSTFSRFDAHSGMWNGKIINGSTFHTVALIGGGEMLVENSTHIAEFYKSGNNSLFGLRSDYGSTWEGSVTFRNVDSYVYTRDPDTTDTHTWDGIYVFGHSYTNWYFGYTCYVPSIELDNVNFYDIETGTPLAAGTEIKLFETDQLPNTKMHLDESHKYAIYPVADTDQDGYVDNPFDLDGDGIVGNSKYKYDDYKKSNHFTSDEFVNVNKVCPPEYITIKNNDGVDGAGGYIFTLQTTATSSNTSNGGHYGVAENYGGFFGATRFEYVDAGGNKKSFFGPFADLAGDTPFNFYD